MYLVFDCSSIDRARNLKSSFSETHAWPRLIHVSWILLGKDLKPIEDFDCIIKPEGFSIDDKIEKNAKIDLDDITKKGTKLEDVLNQFNASVKKADYVFAHNLNYNENVLAAEYIRKGVDIDLFLKERYCLMHESTYFCGLPSKTGGYKWPSLRELHIACFNSAYTPTNNARADVIAAARSFIFMMKRNHLEDLFE